MLTILTATITWVAIKFYLSLIVKRQDYNPMIPLLTGVIQGSFVGITIAVMLPMSLYNKQESIDIEPLKDSNTVTDNFFLEVGKFDGKMQYIFYYKEDSLYKTMQVDCELVQIKYISGEPKLNIIEKVPTDAVINLFAIDSDVCDKSYIIEVPEGAIKSNWNLDTR